MKILMVCLGNICRSPIAEGVLQKLAKEHGKNWIIDSAGTGASFHEGAGAHQHSTAICQKHGIDISHQKARQFKLVDFQDYELIFAMSDDIFFELKRLAGNNEALQQKVKLILNEVHPGKNESVPDPYYGNAQAYPPVYQMIYEACEKIIEHYN